MHLREVVNGILYVVAWRYFLANDAPRPASLGHGLVVLPKMAQGRHLGAGFGGTASRGPGERGTGCYSQRGDHRQPIGEDHGKRGPRGYDAGKKVSGRKRHIVVDTTGLLLAVVIHAANIQDRDGARLVLAKLLGRFPRLQVIWADAAYAGRLVAWAWETGGWLLKVVRRRPDSHQFEVLPRRWVVERTLAWLSRCRRLSKDYEELPETGETWVHIAMVHLMLKRLKPT